jgi:hypothetical protein
VHHDRRAPGGLDATGGIGSHLPDASLKEPSASSPQSATNPPSVSRAADRTCPLCRQHNCGRRPLVRLSRWPPALPRARRTADRVSRSGGPGDAGRIASAFENAEPSERGRQRGSAAAAWSSVPATAGGGPSSLLKIRLRSIGSALANVSSTGLWCWRSRVPGRRIAPQGAVNIGPFGDRPRRPLLEASRHSARKCRRGAAERRALG